MINLRSSKGAVTLYILVALIIFIIILINTQVHLKNKESSVEAEYQKIKSSYQTLDANEVYSGLDI